MGKFKFYQDVKLCLWERQWFEIEAESKEEAIKIASEYKNTDVSSDLPIINREYLDETIEVIYPGEASYFPTIEVYQYDNPSDMYDGVLIAHNAKVKPSSQSNRDLIGYQIHFDDADWPADLWSFQVFRTKEDAEDYIFINNINDKYYDRIVEIYRGDIEEPTLIGTTIRKFNANEEVLYCGNDENVVAYIEAEITIENDDKIAIFPINSDEHILVDSDRVYQKAEGKYCPRCGKQLYIEHLMCESYPYYCSDCDENFYEIEV